MERGVADQETADQAGRNSEEGHSFEQPGAPALDLQLLFADRDDRVRFCIRGAQIENLHITTADDGVAREQRCIALGERRAQTEDEAVLRRQQPCPDVVVLDGDTARKHVRHVQRVARIADQDDAVKVDETTLRGPLRLQRLDRCE